MISPSSTLPARDSTVGAELTPPPSQLVLLHVGFLLGHFCPGTAIPDDPVLPCPPRARATPLSLQTAQLTAFSSASQRALAGSSLSSTASCMMRGPRREMIAPSSGSLRMWWPWALVTRGTSRDFLRYSQHPWYGQLTHHGFYLGPPLCLPVSSALCGWGLGTSALQGACLGSTELPS